jgi:undecaprenyl-diphosphatase
MLAAHPHRYVIARLTIFMLAFALLGYVGGELITGAGVPELGAVRDFAGARTPDLTLIAHCLSWLGRSYVLAVGALVCCLVFLRQGARTKAAALAASVAGAEAISWVDKLLVHRPRPPVAHLETVTSSSFPSGHATTTTAFYLALLIGLAAGARSRALIWLLALATALLILGVAASRVYLGVHYPSDVIGGALLGGGWSLLVARLVPGPLAPRFSRSE